MAHLVHAQLGPPAEHNTPGVGPYGLPTQELTEQFMFHGHFTIGGVWSSQTAHAVVMPY
jgi:hypothetical protein